MAQERNILQYATPRPETAGRVSYVSEPDRLTVTIPAPRAWRLLLLPSAELAAASVIGMALAVLAAAGLLYSREDAPKLALALVIVASGAAAFWLSRLLRVL